MFKRVALVAAVAMFMAMDVQAGIFGSRGGCANGQCGMRTASDQPASKVAVQTTAAPPVAQASGSEACSPAVSASTQPSQQVATRTRMFRRWSR
jgi:hypothetical protein